MNKYQVTRKRVIIEEIIVEADSKDEAEEFAYRLDVEYVKEDHIDTVEDVILVKLLDGFGG